MIALVWIAVLIFCGIKFYSLMNIELGVTNKKLIGKTGIIRHNSLDAYLEKIDNFSINETLGGKLFGYATIQICTTSAKLTFPGIKDAIAFKNIVMDCVDLREDAKMEMQAKYMQKYR